MSSVGILGGTFDPIHFGHLRMAEELADSLNLAEVRFLPAARPPHRDAPRVTEAHRVAMVRLAIAHNPRFALDLRECERSGPSYMVDTLTSLREEIGTTRPLVLLLGADAFLGLPTWHRWQSLFELAHLAVAHRPGFTLGPDTPNMPQALREAWRQRHRPTLPNAVAGSILLREMTALDISASRIRETLRQGRSARYLLPDAVHDYLQQHHLYEKAPHGT